ncbi:hypothetical protein EAI_06749 [Harpegnathos saltator]|uniref:Uncharacterized protein n=1 Tax=Harpegnathos saltator TaxID=610380 RepID=E2C827_HARSA|nr:hypothetical protein EAI_06749 [Harpegnathos saltator]
MVTLGRPVTRAVPEPVHINDVTITFTTAYGARAIMVTENTKTTEVNTASKRMPTDSSQGQQPPKKKRKVYTVNIVMQKSRVRGNRDPKTGIFIPASLATTSQASTSLATTADTATTIRASAGENSATGNMALSKRSREGMSGSSTSSIEMRVLELIPELVRKRDPRGRKATTGHRVGLREKREVKAIRRRVEAENDLEREVEDLLGRGMVHTMSDKRPVEEVFKDSASKVLLREVGSAELASEAGCALGAFRLVAWRS